MCTMIGFSVFFVGIGWGIMEFVLKILEKQALKAKKEVEQYDRDYKYIETLMEPNFKFIMRMIGGCTTREQLLNIADWYDDYHERMEKKLFKNKKLSPCAINDYIMMEVGIVNDYLFDKTLDMLRETVYQYEEGELR